MLWVAGKQKGGGGGENFALRKNGSRATGATSGGVWPKKPGAVLRGKAGKSTNVVKKMSKSLLASCATAFSLLIWLSVLGGGQNKNLFIPWNSLGPSGGL